ncbi:hypothetical protein KBC04_02320 [Candidatus Babeliales bacterium]|nr:hypothetical protein [Candidatus Babeliales bacterium]MBP9843755.1 hypothetical protein [Candidatus Babeliales bacterium]
MNNLKFIIVFFITASSLQASINNDQSRLAVAEVANSSNVKLNNSSNTTEISAAQRELKRQHDEFIKNTQSLKSKIDTNNKKQKLICCFSILCCPCIACCKNC